jgi:hypothetical protein
LHNRWPYTNAPGLENAEGIYNVSHFAIGDSTYPYSLTDTIRWRDVVFEKWNVLSVRRNTLAVPNLASPQISGKTNYEFIGNAGRTFYEYRRSRDTLELANPNDVKDNIRFIVSRPDSVTIRLNGANSSGDSLTIVLNKIDKQYLLFKGRRKPISVN